MTTQAATKYTTEVTITDKNASADVHRLQYSAFASDLRLPPCQFPMTLPTTLGNGKEFLRKGVTDKAAGYKQKDGDISLIVWND